MVGIYKITSPTGKVYIGKSMNIGVRWRNYRKLHCKQQRHLHRSFLKHGVKNHIFEIIEEFYLPIQNELIDAYEESVYVEYVAAGFEMLNLQKPGKFTKNAHSIESRMLMSASRKGNKNRLGRKNVNPFSETTRKRMSEAKMNKVFSEDHKNKIRKSNPRSKMVDQLSEFGILIKEFPSLRSANKELGYGKCKVDNIITGKAINNTGFIFRYK